LEIIMEQIVQALQGLAAAALVAAIALARSYVTDWLARQRLEGALGRAAGIVMADSAVQAAGAVALDAALAIGREYVAESIPGTLKRLGVDGGRLEQMVRGEVGKRAPYLAASSVVGEVLTGPAPAEAIADEVTRRILEALGPRSAA
jgi:hypothetical protein